MAITRPSKQSYSKQVLGWRAYRWKGNRGKRLTTKSCRTWNRSWEAWWQIWSITQCKMMWMRCRSLEWIQRMGLLRRTVIVLGIMIWIWGTKNKRIKFRESHKFLILLDSSISLTNILYSMINLMERTQWLKKLLIRRTYSSLKEWKNPLRTRTFHRTSPPLWTSLNRLKTIQ